MLSIYERAKLDISTAIYSIANPLPIPLLDWKAPEPPDERQYVLRMILRCPGKPILVPHELEWVRKWIALASRHQEGEFGRNLPYCYITVRHGICTSETDDVWHVDGFSMRKRHVAEQNYLYTDVHPTEFLDQRFTIPDDFDPLRHNIQWFFEDRASGPVWIPPERSWVLMDPYTVHRRPVYASGLPRTMVRITFVPVQIEDDRCTPNPYLPVPLFNNVDIRKTLLRYPR